MTCLGIIVSVPERLILIRSSWNESQAVFARKLGLKQPVYARYETGDRTLPDDVKGKISQLGINLHWLITGEGEMFLEKEAPPEAKDKFPEDPEQGMAMLDSMLEMLLKKGVIEEKDIPPPLAGVKRERVKMTAETREMLERKLENARKKEFKIKAEKARIETELKKYSDSDEAHEENLIYGDGGVRLLFPVMGHIAAGEPLDVEQWPDEWKNIRAHPGESPDSHYLLRVSGASMTKIIPDGSLILVLRAELAESGQIVVVFEPDEGVTLKRLRREDDGRIYLLWEDGSDRSREITKSTLIQGIFVRVVEESATE